MSTSDRHRLPPGREAPKPSRRTLLRGVLAGVPVSLGLPVFDALLDGNGEALAGGGPLPRRFGVFFWGGGIVHSKWVPERTGFDWELPESLLPFADLKPYLTLVTGTNHPKSSPGHIPARGIALSSSHDLSTVAAGAGTYRGQDVPEPSVDSLVAEAWRRRALFDSLEIGICRKGPYKSNSSWKRGGRTFNRHEPSPQRLFDRLFRGETALAGGSTEKGSTPLARSTELDKSVLDVVLADAKALGRKLGRSDRERMAQHLDGLRSIEMRLQERERLVQSGVCPEPTRPMARDYGDDSAHEEKEEKNKIMSDLLVVALSCGMTRVFSYEFSGTQSDTIFWEVDVREEHHPLTHKERKGGVEMPRTVRFIMQNFAYLARRLRERREGAGNLLDSTLILGTSEHANAGSHDYLDHPFLLVGKAGGGIRAGLHYRDAKPDNDHAPRVLLTAVRAVGVPLQRLGQEANGRQTTESIGELET